MIRAFALCAAIALAACAAPASKGAAPQLFPAPPESSNAATSPHLTPDCTALPPAPRDAATNRVKRSLAARRAFQKIHPCPVTGRTRGACPGYVVDHIVALKRGGPDHPCNMQWQTRADALIKDRAE